MESIWVVVPSYNEATNLTAVVPQLLTHLSALGHDHRVVIVDDGSRDGTPLAVDALEREFPVVSCIRLRTNKGKAGALRHGFQAALEGGATWIVMMDADGQDDSAELPRLMHALDSGASLVTGARGVRRDPLVKRVTSRFYNWVTGVISRAPGTDFNSGFKAMTADVARALIPTLYGELHRYITVIAHWRGFEVAEVQVDHKPRLHGKSKYGIARFWRGFVDLMTVRFLMSYEERPSHFFSGLGVVLSLAGTVILGYLLVLRLNGETIGERPLLIAGVLLFLTGLQLILFGLLAELVVYRTQRLTSQSDE